MSTTDTRPPYVRRQSAQLRLVALDAQLDAILEAKRCTRAALLEIEAECGEEPTLPGVYVGKGFPEEGSL